MVVGDEVGRRLRVSSLLTTAAQAGSLLRHTEAVMGYFTLINDYI